ncbi:sulfotransferase domain-containing protein [Vreelandella sp. F11]|uniref:sulfotransferase domain-containing protein n=1 Tax=Vreelandella sp. F11 TaxID=3394751 RepID=UPI0036D89B24
MKENKPNFLIVGTQKGGATWLYDCLKKHKQVFLPEKIELLFFNKKNWHDENEVSNYISNFKEADDRHVVIGEQTPSYFWSVDPSSRFCKPGVNHNEFIAKSAAEFCGKELKVIYSLRHPVWRAVSAFFHHAKRNRIASNASIGEYYERFGIVDLGFYSRHINSWVSELSPDNCLGLIMERDIINDPLAGIKKAESFLGVYQDESIVNVVASNKDSSRKYDNHKISLNIDQSPYVTANELCELLEFYREDMDEVRELMKDSLPEWQSIDNSIQKFYLESKKKSSYSLKNIGLVDNNAKMKEEGILFSDGAFKRAGKDCSFFPPSKVGDSTLVRDVKLGEFSYLVDGYFYSVDIGRYCSIARNVNIGQGNHVTSWVSTHPFQYGEDIFGYWNDDSVAESFSKLKVNRQKALEDIRTTRTAIGHDVWIGNGVFISKGVKIGTGAVIGAGSVVTKDVPPYAIAAGVPAKVIRYRFSEKLIERLLASKWWMYAPWQIDNLDFTSPDKFLEEFNKLTASHAILPYITPTIRKTKK